MGNIGVSLVSGVAVEKTKQAIRDESLSHLSQRDERN